MDRPPAASLAETLVTLRAAAEETRLRILALLGSGELTVSDFTDILGQSQPRISRHLKLLTEAGLVERHREGAWAFFRLADRHPVSQPLRRMLDALDPNDERLQDDRLRFAAARQQRATAAQDLFARLAPEWDRLRSLHASEEAVEAAIRGILGARSIRHFADLGTGTGWMLRLIAPMAERASGLDASHAMLAVARAQLEKADLARVELRQGDIYASPFSRDSYDLVSIHQVLHHLDDPSRAIREAARLLTPGGRLLIVDFAPHKLEFLREEQAHRRLGFSHEQISTWLAEAGLDCVSLRDIPPPDDRDGQLTVTLWLGQDRRTTTDWPLSAPNQGIA